LIWYRKYVTDIVFNDYLWKYIILVYHYFLFSGITFPNDGPSNVPIISSLETSSGLGGAYDYTPNITTDIPINKISPLIGEISVIMLIIIAVNVFIFLFILFFN